MSPDAKCKSHIKVQWPSLVPRCWHRVPGSEGPQAGMVMRNPVELARNKVQSWDERRTVGGAGGSALWNQQRWITAGFPGSLCPCGGAGCVMGWRGCTVRALGWGLGGDENTPLRCSVDLTSASLPRCTPPPAACLLSEESFLLLAVSGSPSEQKEAAFSLAVSGAQDCRKPQDLFPRSVQLVRDSQEAP